MKTASLSELKQELLAQPPKKVLELCLRLAKYKKENKELLSFLLFDADNEHGYVESIKLEIDERFLELPHKSWYQTKKSLRSILMLITKYSKHVSAKESEFDMLVHFCDKMKPLGGFFAYNEAFSGMYARQIRKLYALSELIHEDIRSDYKKQIEQLQ